MDSNPANSSSNSTDQSEATILEPWIDWIRRATRYAEDQLARLKIDSWVTTYRRRKWRYAGKLANEVEDCWTKSALDWTPGGARKVGRPKLRWADDISKCLEKVFGTRGNWQSVAKVAPDAWSQVEEEFIKLDFLKPEVLEISDCRLVPRGCSSPSTRWPLSPHGVNFVVSSVIVIVFDK